MCAQVRYLGLVEQLKRLMVDPNLALSAAVYTELADVEAEINGMTTYDRKVPASATMLLDTRRSCRSALRPNAVIARVEEADLHASDASR